MREKSRTRKIQRVASCAYPSTLVKKTFRVTEEYQEQSEGHRRGPKKINGSERVQEYMREYGGGVLLAAGSISSGMHWMSEGLYSRGTSFRPANKSRKTQRAFSA